MKQNYNEPYSNAVINVFLGAALQIITLVLHHGIVTPGWQEIQDGLSGTSSWQVTHLLYRLGSGPDEGCCQLAHILQHLHYFLRLRSCRQVIATCSLTHDTCHRGHRSA